MIRREGLVYNGTLHYASFDVDCDGLEGLIEVKVFGGLEINMAITVELARTMSGILTYSFWWKEWKLRMSFPCKVRESLY